jgi:molybdenum cofactor cytidylyltransferase
MISAIVLAAGISMRMGQQKMLMPWGQTTVIGSIIQTLIEARVDEINVVTGGNETALKAELKMFSIRYIYNPDFANGEMLTSVQVGLKSLGDESEAALIVLGDQPQIELNIVREIIDRYNLTPHKIIVPSYQKHRGHPWIVAREFWKEICTLSQPQTLRNFLNTNNEKIDYLTVDSPTIIQDIDTQADYLRYKP